MRKVVVVAVREYLAAVKSKAFVITILIAPLLMASGIIAEKVFDRAGTNVHDRSIAVIDHTGVLFDKLAAMAELRNAAEIFMPPDGPGAAPKQVMPRFILERVAPVGPGDDSAILLSLSQRVRDGDLFAFAEIESGILEPAAPGDDRTDVTYFSNAPTYRDASDWLAASINQCVQERRLAASGIDPATVNSALQPANLERLGLLTRDPATGAVVRAEKINMTMATLVPVMMVVLMFMVIMMAAGPLIQSVLEEKLQRISEVLLGCVDPFQWMLGKLLGMVGVSLTVVSVYIAGGLVVASERGVLSLIPIDLFGWFCAYQILAVLMFGAVFIAAGAACSDHREAQTALTPLMVIIVLPMMMLKTVITEPNSTLATVASFFPPVTPMVMLLRQAIPPGIPAWQPAVAMVLVVLTTLLCVFAAGRVFRVGILMQGGGVKFRDMLRWIIRG